MDKEQTLPREEGWGLPTLTIPSCSLFFLGDPEVPSTIAHQLLPARQPLPPQHSTPASIIRRCRQYGPPTHTHTQDSKVEIKDEPTRSFHQEAVFLKDSGALWEKTGVLSLTKLHVSRGQGLPTVTPRGRCLSTHYRGVD